MPKTIHENAQNLMNSEHAACGVVMRIDMDVSHELVEDALKRLSQVEYRSGYNPLTGESDGAGIRFFGLPTPFFINKIQSGVFKRLDTSLVHVDDFHAHQYAIGQYFLPTDAESSIRAQQLIEHVLANHSLVVLGWRDLSADVDESILSSVVLQKKPGIWQAIIQPKQDDEFDALVLKSALEIYYEARNQGISINILSQSAESIVYKGMVRPSQLGQFYQDLSHPEFTARAFINHARFATNTNPRWENAQPCVFFWAHNGELNSAAANALEMRDELFLHADTFKGVYPNAKLSDSMQFDADMANLVAQKNISMIEAFTRLMPPMPDTVGSDAQQAMLDCFMMERSPYNGPAFAVAGYQGFFVAKLDSVGLRPSRWTLLKDANGKLQFFAASDDLIELSKSGNILKKGHLQPGGMLVFTPDGKLLQTHDVLSMVVDSYPKDHFQQLMASMVTPIETLEVPSDKLVLSEHEGGQLNRILYASGWDFETKEHVVRYMATHGVEKVAAMGDDTNPLHATIMPPHISYFFHQLFAQVSAPPLDSTHEPENFSLKTFLGMKLGQKISIHSPMLNIHELMVLESQQKLITSIIDITFEPNAAASIQAQMTLHLQQCMQMAMDAAKQGGVIILSDRNMDTSRLSVPDLIVVAAVRRYLEQQALISYTSIVIDSYQVSGPHHASCLLALGANAVYPRGPYATIVELFETDAVSKAQNFQHALNKCLLKTMGKMGITDVNNYVNGHLVAALGLNLDADSSDELFDNPSLAAIFSGIYSPLKGVGLSHIGQALLLRHQQAFDAHHDFVLMPHSGYYMPEKNGLKHGYGPVVVNAFTVWLKQEDIRAILARMNKILLKKGFSGFLPSSDDVNLQGGFLDPGVKVDGYYPEAYLEQFKPSVYFREMIAKLDAYRLEHPTCIRDHFKIRDIQSVSAALIPNLQTQQEIRRLLFAGSMSQGALTVSDPNKPHQLGAHETLTSGMNTIGCNSGSGEGGEGYHHLRTSLLSTKSKQIASGRFGVNTAQIMHAEEMEIKIAQGAKPGEGGQLPGSKVSIRFAAQRGGLPGTPFVSPPPHHDIYSIEDLEQLIFDIKTVNPKVKVAVKLVASMGIGTIAVGVAKAGADVINIAGNSGGTGAAQQSSIKHTGMPAEIGLVEVDRALKKANLREQVQLRVSGGFKTADDVIGAAIFGADLFEFGTTSMLTLGCKMQRTCNQSCQPGVATDGQLFKGNQLNVERYFVNLAALIQERLAALGVASLAALRGKTELLELVNPKLSEHYDFSMFLTSEVVMPLEAAQLQILEQNRLSGLVRRKEDVLFEQIKAFFDQDPSGIFVSPEMQLDTQDRSFGARIAGTFVSHLEAHPHAKIVLNTHGNAGQSFGFVMPKGMIINHKGVVQDGCAKSMCGGEIVLSMPNQHLDYKADANTIAGNVMLYGASAGRAFVNGVAGHRFAILCKGAEIVVEGAGDFAFEYMTSGTGLIIGSVGKGLGLSASGGILLTYDPTHQAKGISEDLRLASAQEAHAYESVIKALLSAHIEKTSSLKAQEILANFSLADFQVLIPKALDNINNPQALLASIKTFLRPEVTLSLGMQVWLQEKTLALLEHLKFEAPECMDLVSLLQLPSFNLFSEQVKHKLLSMVKPVDAVVKDIEDLVGPHVRASSQTRTLRSVQERLEHVSGILDELYLNALEHIEAYVADLSQDALGCSGCRAQSCAGGDGVDTGCPSGKPINTINAILQRLGPVKNGLLSKQQWHILREAFEVQIKDSPFIAYTGAACPAPCQDACTETIPELNIAESKRGTKLVGEPVHIKDIEFHLYLLARGLGWLDGKKQFLAQEQHLLFGGQAIRYQQYQHVLKQFNPPFLPPVHKQPGKKLVVIGSGPAAMQIAFEALRDGLEVEMYEKSDKPGGLLVDGIPAHKFDKQYLLEDFSYLQEMGLKLFLNHEVSFEPVRKGFYSGDRLIAMANDAKCHVVLCLGAGQPVTLDESLMPKTHQDKIIQAVDLLKAKNDIAASIKANPAADKELLIQQHLGNNDPRGKNIVVIGGGDTAQDVVRWVARYFNDEASESKGSLDILVRGLPVHERGIMDAYPTPSKAPTKENHLKAMEVSFVNGNTHHAIVPQAIDACADSGKLTLHLGQIHYKHQDEIDADPELSSLDKMVPREFKPKARIEEQPPIENVDMIVLALGFKGKDSIPMVGLIEEAGLTNVSYAGDLSGVKSKIIVGAQASAHETYNNRIKPMMDVRPPQHIHSMFSAVAKDALLPQSKLERGL